jgi:hypothetical protein
VDWSLPNTWVNGAIDPGGARRAGLGFSESDERSAGVGQRELNFLQLSLESAVIFRAVPAGLKNGESRAKTQLAMVDEVASILAIETAAYWRFQSLLGMNP